MSNEHTQAYTVIQAAKRLGISVRAMRDLIARYEIQAYDVTHNPGTGRARWRITEEAIQDFQDKRSNRPTTDTPRRRSMRRPIPSHV
jgi:excisionase family DNA binding protein